MTNAHPLLDAAARREKKATALAYTAWAYGIAAADMVTATSQEWAQLAEATRLSMNESYGEPSLETKGLVIAKLRELEKGAVAA